MANASDNLFISEASAIRYGNEKITEGKAKYFTVSRPKTVRDKTGECFVGYTVKLFKRANRRTD